MPDAQEVLSANREFYRAFAERDLEAMHTLWAREAPVACIHPGWNALAGRRPVLESWGSIFLSPEPPTIRCHLPRAYLLGEVAFVICYEVLERGSLTATNTFARERGAWKMVHHQAGPAGALPSEQMPEPPGVVH